MATNAQAFKIVTEFRKTATAEQHDQIDAIIERYHEKAKKAAIEYVKSQTN